MHAVQVIERIMSGQSAALVKRHKDLLVRACDQPGDLWLGLLLLTSRTPRIVRWLLVHIVSAASSLMVVV